MESMISDQNRSIATLAITTLLKTGNESSIDRLMKQISTFMSDIQVKICTPCKFKVSAQTLLYFRTSLKLLSSRQSRNFAWSFRTSIAFSWISSQMFYARRGVLSTKKQSSTAFYVLSKKSLMQQKQGWHTWANSLRTVNSHICRPKYSISLASLAHRRQILASTYATFIRASAVCALASFGSCSVALRARVSILLQRCLYDNDDEVRDRAAFFLSALRKSSSETDSHRNDDASTYLLAPLELSLQKYLQETVDSAFDVGAVSQLENDNASHPDMHATSVDRTLPNTSSSSECDLRESENVIMSRPEFMSYGPIFKARAFLYPFRTQIKTPTTEILCIFCWYLQTCHAVELTEAETEYKVRSNARTKMCLDVFIADFVESYQVTCTKHIFKEHVVFHFKCSNTIEDQILENVSVVMEIIEGTEAFAEVLTVPLGTMPLGQFGSTFVSYERAQVWISFLRTRPQDVNLFCNAGTLSSC